MTSYSLWINKFLEDRNGVLGVVILLMLLGAAIFAPYLAPYPQDFTVTLHPREKLQPPSSKHLFGTDHLGRDIFSRVIFGARVTLMIAGVAISGALLIGTVVGLTAGYYEGWVGSLLMRITDIFVSLPRIVMALAVVAALGPGIRNAILALTITYWPFWARVAYANVVTLKKSPFVEATKALGASSNRIVFLHMLPNAAPGLIVRTTIGMGGTIITAAVLSFVGLGSQPPTADWGLMLAFSREYLPAAWWYSLFPGLAIFLVVMAFNMFGDTLRDVVDPRFRISGKGKKRIQKRKI